MDSDVKVDIKWLEDALSSKEVWKSKAKDILDALNEQAVETVADIRLASPETWGRVLVGDRRLPGVVEDLVKAKAAAQAQVPAGPSSAPGAVIEQLYLDKILTLLVGNTPVTNMALSFIGVDSWQGNIDIGKLFPFVGRDQPVSVLSAVIHKLLGWWRSIKQDPGTDLNELHKRPGFGFIVCGAASGIGKSTFARAAFVELFEKYKKAKDDNGGNCCRRYTMLQKCLDRKMLYRTSFVDSKDWEPFYPERSIAFRLLHAFCKNLFADQSYQSFSTFAQAHTPPESLSLPAVINFMRSVLGIEPKEEIWIVNHLDELNHLDLTDKHKQYMKEILKHLYHSMTLPNTFMVNILTGTNTEELCMLKIISGFATISINLPPLTLFDMWTIFSEVMKRLAATTPLPKVISDYVDAEESDIQACVDILLDDCGGNPQVEKLLLIVLASNASSTEKRSFVISEKRAEELLNNIAALSLDRLQHIRDLTWNAVENSSILGSLNVSGVLGDIIFGYALTGDIVSRDTVLTPGINVAQAEGSGSLNLIEVTSSNDPKNQRFQISLPRFYLQSFQFHHTTCPPLLALKNWTTDPRANKHHDIDYFAFRVWWLKTLHPGDNTFTLAQLLPTLTIDPKYNVSLMLPSNFTVTEMGINVHNDYERHIHTRVSDNKHFFLGVGQEKFVDSWAVFQVSNTFNFLSVMIQSRQTLTGRASTDTSTQLTHCKKAIQSPHMFQLLIISDGPIEHVNDTRVHYVDQNGLEPFFGPVLGPLRIVHVVTRHGSRDRRQLGDYKMKDINEVDDDSDFEVAEFSDED